MIPCIDVSPLFEARSRARDAADRAVIAAAADPGFMTVRGLPSTLSLDAVTRRKLLGVFTLDRAARGRLLRRKFDPSRPNLYRGWYPAQDGAPSYKEGIDMGPDVAHGAAVIDPDDPLREATPLPAEEELPGWRDAAAAWYRGSERVGEALMRAVARGLGLPGDCFDEAFRGGVSTLRVIRYPVRTPASMAGIPEQELWVEHGGRRHAVIGRAHCDSGLLTLLAQDGVAGLQARTRDGHWQEVPPAEGTLSVNFGRLLERWTGGRVQATEHRVLGGETPRCSVPFFYEARVDALIAPLPLPGAPAFEPFLYGDHVWESTTKFVEFAGMADLRPPRGPRAA